jgi:hypothetical protein
MKGLDIKTMPVCFSNIERIIYYESLPPKPSTKRSRFGMLVSVYCFQVWSAVATLVSAHLCKHGEPILLPPSDNVIIKVMVGRGL